MTGPRSTTTNPRGAAPTSAELAARVAELEDQLARLIDVVADKLTPAADSAGPAADGPQGVQPAGTEPQPTLEEWVADMGEFYYLATEFKGWEDNTAMRAELAGLKVAHHHAYSTKAGPWDQLSWHDHLNRVVARFAESEGPKRRAERQNRLTDAAR